MIPVRAGIFDGGGVAMPHQEKQTAATGASVYERAQAAFYRDLPRLLKTHLGQWVAYHGDDFVGCGRTQTELYRRCIERGLRENEFVVLFADHAALADHEEIELPWPP
jgi:hypothetical protein